MENINMKSLLEHNDPITTVFIHGLKYEADEETNQACFYVQDIEENSQTLCSNRKQFLWQSQKWILTHCDESKRIVSIVRKKPWKRTFKRRLKTENEGYDYEITEVISLDVTEDHNGTSHLREYIWKPKRVNREETFMLVTYVDSSEPSKKRAIPQTLSTSYTGDVKREDFEITYDANDTFHEDYEEQPEGALAKITYVSEKLAHIRKVDSSDEENDENDVYEIEPINIKISFEPVTLWVSPYEGRYGLSTSHFQVSERLGDSCETSLIKVTTRGGYLSDFSLSYSDVRKFKKYRHRHEKQPHYNNLPSDVIVIDKLEEESQASQHSNSDDEGFEEIEIPEHTTRSDAIDVCIQKPSSPQSNYGSEPALTCQKDIESDPDSGDNPRIFDRETDEMTETRQTIAEDEQNSNDCVNKAISKEQPITETKTSVDDDDVTLKEFICNGITKQVIHTDELNNEIILTKPGKNNERNVEVETPKTRDIIMAVVPSATIVTVVSDSDFNKVKTGSKYVNMISEIQEDLFEQTRINKDIMKKDVDLDFMLNGDHHASVTDQSEPAVTDQSETTEEQQIEEESKQNEQLKREADVLDELLEFRKVQMNNETITRDVLLNESVLPKPTPTKNKKLDQQNDEGSPFLIRSIPAVQTKHTFETENTEIKPKAKMISVHRQEVKEEMLQACDHKNNDVEKEIEFKSLFSEESRDMNVADVIEKNMGKTDSSTMLINMSRGKEKEFCEDEFVDTEEDEEEPTSDPNKNNAGETNVDEISCSTSINVSLHKKRNNDDKSTVNENSSTMSESMDRISKDVTGINILLNKPDDTTHLNLNLSHPPNDQHAPQVNISEISSKPKKKSLASRAKKAIMKQFKGNHEVESKSQLQSDASEGGEKKTKKKSRIILNKKSSHKKNTEFTDDKLSSDVWHKNVVYRRSDTMPVKTVADRITLLRQNSSEGMLEENEKRSNNNRGKLVRSKSFESILESSKKHNKLDTELYGRRKRLAGYSYFSYGTLQSSNDIVKSREYTLEACEKEMTKEIRIIKRERKKHSLHKSMETSLDVVSRIQNVGHINIPDVFQGNTGSPKLRNNQVGKILIPKAFSVNHLDSDNCTIVKTREVVI